MKVASWLLITVSDRKGRPALGAGSAGVWQGRVAAGEDGKEGFNFFNAVLAFRHALPCMAEYRRRAEEREECPEVAEVAPHHPGDDRAFCADGEVDEGCDILPGPGGHDDLRDVAESPEVMRHRIQFRR